MKTCHTYPTKHPHWIDEDDYATRHGKAGRRWRERMGISFPMAFAIVLGLHLAVIGGFYAFGSSKKTKAAALGALAAAEKPIGPKSDALARNDWPQTNAKPKLVAKAPAVKAPDKPTIAEKAKPASTPLVAKIAVPTPKRAVVAPTPIPEAAELKKIFLSTRQTQAPEPAPESRRAEPLEKPAQPLVAQDSEVVRIPSPAPAAPVPQPRRASATGASEYTLQPGDNLYMVSRKLEVSFNDLMQANGLSDPRQLRVGQKLKVPVPKQTTL
jgi:LysM repeat protein